MGGTSRKVHYLLENMNAEKLGRAQVADEIGLPMDSGTVAAPAAKVKYPRADAMTVAAEICTVLKPVTERLICAGSIRRRRPMVGDVEILYVPRISQLKVGLFDDDQTFMDLSERAIAKMLESGMLAKRLNKNGIPAWGPKIKLAVHWKSGIPVDLFATTHESWFNYLVCRTGSAENNVRICEAAQAKGYKWNPYGSGFSSLTGHAPDVIVTSEADVYSFAGLPYLEPWQR